MPKPRIRDLETAQGLLDLRRAEYQENVELLTARLQNGELSLVQWRSAVRQEIKDLNTQALIYGRAGEWESLTQRDFGGLGADLKKQYGRVDELALQLQSSAGGTITTDWVSYRAGVVGDMADASFWRGVGRGYPNVPPRIRNTELGAKLLGVRRSTFDDAVVQLNNRLIGGDISLAQWRVAMRREIKDLHTSALIIARGGEYGAISQADWGRLGADLKKQYRFLDGYAEQVRARADAAAAGEADFLSDKYMDWRSKLYGGASNASYWRGVVYGLLPQVPGDGQTQCKTNCRCILRIEDGDEQGIVLIYWLLGEAEHCPDCVQLAAEWNPYELELPLAARMAAARQGVALGGLVASALSDLEHNGITAVVYAH